jgi:tetratricopeptide (TPR) repeat protein
VVGVLFFFALSAQSPSSPDVTDVLAAAAVRAAEFDLTGAVSVLNPAAAAGDISALAGAIYMRGLIAAREAARQGGSPESLAPVREAIASLEKIANGRAGSAEIARLMLHAAAAAAQSEREEMRLYLDTAIRMEALQREAGLSGAPVVSAAELAGDLWLQVHRYDEARRAYEEAAKRAGSPLRTLSGWARLARSINEMSAACAAYRALLDEWGGRAAQPAEITEARMFVAGSCQQRSLTR